MFATIALVFLSSTDVQPLNAYRADSLEITVQGFASPPRVRKNGEILDLGYFAQQRQAVFGESPLALKAIGRYRALRISGFTVWAVGFGALLTDLVLVSVMPHQDALYGGLLAGGVVTSLTGSLLIAGSNSYLQRAVDEYNADLYRRLTGASIAGRQVTMKYAFHF